MTYLLIPLIIIGAAIVLLGLTFFLGRFRGGKLLRPIVKVLMKVGFMKRWFERMSKAAIERTHPDLASAFRKLERLGPRPDPQKQAQVIHQFTPAERAAYMNYSEEQGAIPEPANRQQRRMQERFQQGAKPVPVRAKKPGKKRR